MQSSILTIYVAAALVATGAASAAVADQAAPAPQPDQPKVCQMVVSAERGAKPYQLCMTREEWALKKIADAKDANRMICHYQEQPGTRFRSAKVCMSAAEWDNERLRMRQKVEEIQSRVCVPGAGC